MKHMGQDERNRIEFMLGCKFQKAADRAVLKKNGVAGQKKMNSEK